MDVASDITIIRPTRGLASLQLRAVWQYRELLFFLAWRDIKVRYKQTALGVAWIVLVPVEFLGISSGLGYIINDARDTMEYDRLMAIVLAIGLIGFLLDGTIQLLQKLFRWNWVS